MQMAFVHILRYLFGQSSINFGPNCFRGRDKVGDNLIMY